MEVRNPMRSSEPPRQPMPEVGHHQTMFGRPSMASKILIVLLIILSVLVIGAIGMQVYSAAAADVPVKGKQYQALFLTNGQVYFGKLSNVNSDYVKLKDIYYLQVQQQQVQSQNQNQNNQQPQISLAKLGGELHGPEDVMYISRDQVLFWENLKGDGKVTTAIQDHKKENK